MTSKKHLIVASLGTLALLGAGCGAAPETPAPAPSAPAPSAEMQNPAPAAAEEAPIVRTAEPPAAPQGAKAIADGSYMVAANSKVTWEGRKPLVSGYADKGTLDVKEGAASVKDGKMTEGNVVIDMKTLKATAMAKAGAEAMLEKHLKGADFFDVEKYPTAALKITSVEPAADASSTFRYTVKGDLTMKEKTNAVEFPATIYAGTDGKLHAAAKLDLNRAKWDIRFGSDTFFDNLANNVIDDYFTLSFDIVGDTKK
jgi:polyisoprenoid-binding protein YceI